MYCLSSTEEKVTVLPVGDTKKTIRIVNACHNGKAGKRMWLKCAGLHTSYKGYVIKKLIIHNSNVEAMRVMKSIITLLAVTLSITNKCQGQITSFKNFYVENSDLIYQVVFDTIVSIAASREYYNSLPKAKNVQVFDGYITAEFENEPIDCRKYGRKWGTTPILFNHDNFSGKVKLEFKSDRYRLTIFGIKTVANSIHGTTGDLSSYALKKNRTEIRPPWATDDLLGLINDFFLDNFKVKSTTKKDW